MKKLNPMENHIDKHLMTQAQQYLALPYARIILPDSDGTFRGEVMEFSGCIATGDTAAETLKALEVAAESWLMAALANQQSIPKPIDDGGEFSGKLMVRIPKSLHKKAARIAERDGVSLNQFIMASVAVSVGERQLHHRLVSNITNSFTQNTQNFLVVGSTSQQVHSTRLTQTHRVNQHAGS